MYLHYNSSSLLKPEHKLMESLSSFLRGHTKVHLKGRTIVEHCALKMAYKNRLYRSFNLTQFNPKKEPELTKSISNIWLQSLKDLWAYLLRLWMTVDFPDESTTVVMGNIFYLEIKSMPHMEWGRAMVFRGKVPCYLGGSTPGFDPLLKPPK